MYVKYTDIALRPPKYTNKTRQNANKLWISDKASLQLTYYSMCFFKSNSGFRKKGCHPN